MNSKRGIIIRDNRKESLGTLRSNVAVYGASSVFYEKVYLYLVYIYIYISMNAYS